MARSYRIVRFFQRDPDAREVIETGLTLKQAQRHCDDPETSCRTATMAEAIERTERRGPWFDGYYEE